jgi:phage protein D
MTSEARRPRGFVKLNGQTVPVLSFRTVENAHFQCDTFQFEIGLWPDGLEAWGGDSSGIMAEVMLGFLQPGDTADAMPPLDSLLIGEIDDVDADTIGGTVTLSGRDLTGRLIDSKVSETWPDRTASEIVTDLAGKAGLSPKVTATKVPVGKYAKDQYAALGRDVPIWDLISTLAQAEGFDAYVKGTTLYFGPAEADDGDPLEITLKDGQPIEGNVLSLNLKRSLTLAKDITVMVISYSPRKKTPIKAVAKRQGAAKSASTSFRTGKTSQNYTIRKPGLTQQQADDLAKKTLKSLSEHERTFSANLIPDTTTRSRGKATISGTDSGWDTSYFVDTVTRDYSASGGLSMTVTAKNHDVESQAA